MPVSFAHSPEFLRLLQHASDVDLTRVALEIARDAYPELDPATVLDRINGLAGRVRERCPSRATARTMIGHINWVLYIEEGFQGSSEDYYDPRNSYLNEVLDRKRGIPISLSILYQGVAGRVGLAMSGVNLPGHFVLRWGDGHEPLFVDPFHAGAILDREGCVRRAEEATGRALKVSDEHLAPCSAAEVVARMLRNLKAIHASQGDFASCILAARRLATLCPDDPAEQRDYGLCCVRAGRPGESIAPLAAYLKRAADAPDAADVEALLRAARIELATWN